VCNKRGIGDSEILKTRLLIIIPVFLAIWIIPSTDYVFGDKSFEIDDYIIRVDNDLAIDVELLWNDKDQWNDYYPLPSGIVTLSEEFTGDVKLMIPKHMPRTMNLDFGSGFFVFDTDVIPTQDNFVEVKEYETRCDYVLVLPFDSEKSVAFDSVSVATGRWEPVSISDPSCGEYTLKQQIENDVKSSEIGCQNESHILAKRDSGELACVHPYSMVKLDWEPARYSYYIESLMKGDTQHNIFAYYSQYKNVESIEYNPDSNSIIIHLYSDKPEKLSIKLKRDLLDVGGEHCLPYNYPGFDDYFVLINGREVIFDERIITEKYRYLEIPLDAEDGMLEAEEIRLDKWAHDNSEIPYHKDSKIIEIIGTCLI